MDKVIKVIALGGLDEKGKNCYAIEIDGDIFVLDSGVKFPDKLTPGIDYIIARFDYLFANKDRVRGYFISHGHDQVLGALPYFYRKVPALVYCTSVTKFMIDSFMLHNHLSFDIEYNIIKSGDTCMVAGRPVSFFSVSHNIPQSVGISIYTDYGNIIYFGSYVLTNSNEGNFTYDRMALVNILSKKNTLLLLNESYYAEHPGYTSPNHDFSVLAEPTFRTAKGRIFAAVLAPDIYTISKLLNLAIKYNRKIIAYNEEAKQIFYGISKASGYVIPEKNVGHRDDVNRYRPNEVLVIMTAFESRLFNTICLLANGQNDDKRFKLNETDTFIYGSKVNNETEIAYTESLDELYKANVNVVYFRKNSFTRMHASQEDIKDVINFTKPKYYLPVSGSYSQLIANAMLAVSMDCGLNFSNVFVLDNGNVIEFNNGVAHLSKETVVTGDLFVDGTGLGNGSSETMEERTQLGEQGVVILSAGFSKSLRTITFGPVVNSKGLMFSNESDQMNKDIIKMFSATLNDEIRKPVYNIKNVESTIKEVIFRYIRRVSQRSPIIIVSLFEIE